MLDTATGIWTPNTSISGPSVQSYSEDISGRNAGENLAAFDLVRYGSDFKFYKADANAVGGFPARGITRSIAGIGTPVQLVTNGVLANSGWNWTGIGAPIYLSETPGQMTQTAPSTSGSAVQIVGWAISATEAYFNFSGHWVVAP